MSEPDVPAEPAQEDKAPQALEDQAPEPQERRREFRLNKMLTAEIGQQEAIEKARLFVINLSRTGMRATYGQPLPEGGDLRLRLFLKAQEALDLSVRVVWVKELKASGSFDIGFEFQQLEGEDWERLTRFLETESQKVEAKTLDLKGVWNFGKV